MIINKIFKLPTESRPFYNFSQVFQKGIEVTFTFRFNEKADCYFMDIGESYEDTRIQNTFISSIPVTEGFNLIQSYHLSVLSVECLRVNADPEIETNRYKELGDSFQVFVIVEDEII